MKKAIYHTSDQMDLLRMRISKEIKEDFRISCEKNNQTMSAVLLQLITDYIEAN